MRLLRCFLALFALIWQDFGQESAPLTKSPHKRTQTGSESLRSHSSDRQHPRHHRPIHRPKSPSWTCGTKITVAYQSPPPTPPVSPFRRLLFFDLYEFFDVPPEWRSHRRRPSQFSLQMIPAFWGNERLEQRDQIGRASCRERV